MSRQPFTGTTLQPLDVKVDEARAHSRRMLRVFLVLMVVLTVVAVVATFGGAG